MSRRSIRLVATISEPVFSCSDMDRLQTCVVEKLEACEESTPANLVDAMFKFVRNETVCGEMKRVSETDNDGM